MTRFARAKGSKASNEKLPEQATSWEQMKQDLLNKNREKEDEKLREEALLRRQSNYQAFLKEKEEEEDKKVAWADFPEVSNTGRVTGTQTKKRKANFGHIESTYKKAKTDNFLDLDNSEDSDGQFSALKLQIDKVLMEKQNDSDSDEAPEEVSNKEQPKEIVIKKAKKPKQKLKLLIVKEGQSSKKSVEKPKKIKTEDKNLTEKDKRLIAKKIERKQKQNEKKMVKKQIKRAQNLSENDKNDIKSNKNMQDRTGKTEADKMKNQKKLERRQKQKEKRKCKNEFNKAAKSTEENLTEEDLKKIQKKKDRRARQAEKRKLLKKAKEETEKGQTNLDEQRSEVNSNKNSFKVNELHNNDNFHSNKKFNDVSENKYLIQKRPNQKLKERQNQKHAKVKDNKEHQSRKQKPEKMIINGRTVDVDYIDGFPVKKEDADRLRKLRKEMISKGLPRSEINASLKLERRRAEKAFAREKKNVCFNCRKSGHNLSECPELDKDQVAQSTGTGICFKCGSTEHTHFECKVVKGLDYKFASCFICKEQGHIARQCPDNQRGLYPKGGSCKVCGDVTHLKKDCLKYQAQQAHISSSLSIGTMDGGNPDDIQGSTGFVHRPMKRMNNVIKF